FYQGSELWLTHLVDPDNRRPVDYTSRERLLREMLTAAAGTASLADYAAALAQDMRDGRCKLFLTWRGLALRRAARESFQAGDYLPLWADGEKAQHVCAFARTWQGRAAITVAPRLWSALIAGDAIAPAWGDTA